MQVKYLIFIIVAFVQLNISLIAQNQNLTGQVLDASNGSPVEFANLGIKSTHLGDATDEDGYFQLNVSPADFNKTVTVSAVGYQTKELAIATLLETKELIIRLIPVVYGIDQVDVTAPSRVLHGMLKMAVRRVPNNYITSPYSADVTYRETEGHKKRTLEMVYTDASGYSKRTWANAFLDRDYKIKSGTRNFEYAPFSGGMVRVEELLEFDYVRNPGNILDTVFLDYFHVFEKEKYLHNGKHVLVIGFKCQNPEFVFTGDTQIKDIHGEIHVVQNDMHILQSKAQYTSSGRLRHGRSFMVDNELENTKIDSISYSVQADYEQNDNKVFLKRVRMDTREYLNHGQPSIISSYELIFTNIMPRELLIKEGSRDYYDNVSTVQNQ